MSDRAQAFRKDFRRVVVLPSGAEVVVRKVDQLKLVEETPPSDDPAGNAEFVRRLLLESMEDPRFWAGPLQDCPDDAIAAAHLGVGDMRILIDAVLEFNGMSQEVARLTGSFRAGGRGLVRPELGVAGPDGKTLEDLPPGDSAVAASGTPAAGGDLPPGDGGGDREEAPVG